MDIVSEAEEVIPPTPKALGNGFLLSRISSKSSKTSGLPSRNNKNCNANFKRKKISGVSPDFKKCKQKAKQITLLNFLAKGNETNKTAPNSESHASKVRINLTKKLECSELPAQAHKKEDIEVIESLSEFSSSRTSQKETANKVLNLESPKEKMKIFPFFNNTNETSVCDFKICSEIKSLKLDSERNKNKISDFLSSTNLGCDSDLLKNNIDETYNPKHSTEDAGQSFSWCSDINWEGMEDNSAENEGYGHSQERGIRYKVKEMNRESPNEIKLTLNDPDPKVTNLKSCILRGFWADTFVNVGDFVNVLEDFKNKQAVIDDNNGFLIVNPDFLVSSTAVVSTLFCMRKAVLNYILPQWSPGNSIMIIGSLVHDIFQMAVNKHVNSAGEIIKIIEKVMKKPENLLSLCSQDLTEEEIKEKVIKFVPHIYDWIVKYCNFNGKSSSESIQVTEIQGIEDNVWCPKYGIKGKIDLTVNAVLRNQSVSKLMPLELKTGRPTFSAEHVGQVNLYSLMLEEQTKEVSDGLLLYLRDGVNMKVIKSNHNSRRGLIQLRNELAFYAHKWSACASQGNEDIEMCHLPSPINDKRLCEKCPYLLPCTVYQSAFSGVNNFEVSHAMKNLVSVFTSHLDMSDLEYFKKWTYLLQLESSNNAEVKAFWDEDAVSRERQGMCLSWVCLAKNQSVRQETEDGLFVHTFHRSSNSPEKSCFNVFGLKEGDYVAISNQGNPDEVAVAMGYIVKVYEYFVEVAIERDLNTVARYKDCVFRIDKQISSSSTAYIRNNLVHLMANDNQAAKLRKFIVQKQEPRFLSSLPKQVVLVGRPILKSLNKVQQKTILKALMAEDYFLIKGMPGTGKTTTIVALVRLLVKMGISVLLTSYTHSAIDNILLKLMGHTEFVRIGSKARIHPDIKQYAFENLTSDFSSVDDFITFMKEKMVVATTCLSVNHEIFHIRKFDVCIIDEASQINQIACLGPIFHATKFILVGDDKQLPPLVINDKARLLGMQESLFQRLQNPRNCMELVIQYRMNEEIMRLCNELTYNGALQCESEHVAQAVLDLSSELKNASTFYPAWLLSVFDHNLKKSVFFLNTDSIYSSVKNTQGQSRNNTEVDIIVIILQFITKHKVATSHTGIIAPYRKQVDLIQCKLKDFNIEGIEVNTVDQYQGRDKDIIIISCVKSNDAIQNSEKISGILDDERRLNVAISRAKKKLIILGSKSALMYYKPFEKLRKCLRPDQFLDLYLTDINFNN